MPDIFSIAVDGHIYSPSTIFGTSRDRRSTLISLRLMVVNTNIRCAELRMFKRVNCGEILLGLSADVVGKMRRCGYVITLSSSSSSSVS